HLADRSDSGRDLIPSPARACARAPGTAREGREWGPEGTPPGPAGDDPLPVRGDPSVRGRQWAGRATPDLDPARQGTGPASPGPVFVGLLREASAGLLQPAPEGQPG